MSFAFRIEKVDGKARAGVLITAHGAVQTPIFMPVGTKATVKAVPQEILKNEIKAQIILGNNYHLYIRPGSEIIHLAGGLHKFMNWDLPILTDSGGFQVYSLKGIRKITERGVIFQSHLDGSKHLFTPENVVDMQRILGSDIMMPLDECTHYPCDYEYAKKSMSLTHRWEERGRKHFLNTQPLYEHFQAQFGIVQGSTYADLRKISAEKIAELNFEGNAIGGLSTGEPTELMYEMTELVCNILPENKPRYLMGVGTPVNILEAIALGVDMFDCVMPTRNARHGLLFFHDGIRNLMNAKYKNDFSPIDPDSELSYDKNYSKAYLHHLLKNHELLGFAIASFHNLHFYLSLVREARKKIIEGTFHEWKNQKINQISYRH
jgi:queuine tRNA-ribosyltransferase